MQEVRLIKEFDLYDLEISLHTYLKQGWVMSGAVSATQAVQREPMYIATIVRQEKKK